MITSAQNPKVKLVRALQAHAKDRRKEAAFVVEGVRLVDEALAANWRLRFVLHGESLNPRARSLIMRLADSGVEVEPVPEPILQSLSETETPQGILAVVELLPVTVPNLEFTLVPDQIRDPGNLGTLLRTAASAGIRAVFIPPETTDPFAPKVVRAAMGAHFRLPIHLLPWDAIGLYLKRKRVYLADAAGELTCWEADLRPPLALIIGGEAEGASQEARALASQTVRIPMPGGMESLNAGVAGAILMFEAVRQQTQPAQNP